MARTMHDRLVARRVRWRYTAAPWQSPGPGSWWMTARSRRASAAASGRARTGRRADPAAAGRGSLHQGLHQRPREGPRQAVHGRPRLHRRPPGHARIGVPGGGHPLEPDRGGPVAGRGPLVGGGRGIRRPAGSWCPTRPVGRMRCWAASRPCAGSIAAGTAWVPRQRRWSCWARSVATRTRCSPATGWPTPTSRPATRPRRARCCWRSSTGPASHAETGGT